MARGQTQATGPRGPHMVTYVIRRLVAAVGLLIVISMVTFAIFFFIPRLAGANAELKRVGGTSDRVNRNCIPGIKSP